MDLPALLCFSKFVLAVLQYVTNFEEAGHRAAGPVANFGVQKPHCDRQTWPAPPLISKLVPERAARFCERENRSTGRARAALSTVRDRDEIR